MPGNGLPRWCSVCNEEKPGTTEYFYANPNGRQGLDARCKVCQKASATRDKVRRMTTDENAEANRAARRDYDRHWARRRAGTE